MDGFQRDINDLIVVNIIRKRHFKKHSLSQIFKNKLINGITFNTVSALTVPANEG
jgi:hypothetical protein